MLIKGIIDRLLHRELISRIRRKGSTLSVIQKGRGTNAIRTLFYNNIIFSSIRLSTIYTQSYWDYFIVLPSIFPKAKILILGLGGGTIPYQMRKIYGKGITIDVVEIDRDIISLSEKFLDEPIDANIINQDALSYIKDTKKRYDIIIMDIYVEDRIPPKFLNINFIKSCRLILKNKGIFAANFASSTSNSVHYKSFKIRIKKVFHSLYTVDLVFIPSNSIFVSLHNITSRSFLKSLNRFPKNKENEFILNAYRKAMDQP